VAGAVRRHARDRGRLQLRGGSLNEFTFAVRFVHFAAAVALFGELAFIAWVALPAGEATRLRERALRVAWWCLALALVSGLAWLAVEAVRMSGLPPARALNLDTLGTVLADTLFGRAWIVRFALAVALGATLLLSRRRAGLDTLSAVLAAGLLSSLAWAGHAAAERGADRIVHLSADAAHLLAAGAWLGALLPLARVLAGTHEIGLAERATRRFSVMGIACVSVLIVTGTASAWYTVGSVPALFGTDYGRLLLAKLALFAAMIALAAANRMRWTPQLRATSPEAGLARRRLRRNAIAETSLGAAVLGVVGALGVTVPALHSQTVWPFPYTIEAGSIVSAYPTTYFVSPVGYTADSVDRGASLYLKHCASCHGARGHGDGPVAASLAAPPPDLTEHIAHHRPGDLLWWLQHGILGTPMPGFGARIGDAGLWDVLNFLHALADAEVAKEMDAGVGEWLPIAAPDFDFQVGERPQESLRNARGEDVLLVFCARPEADARLRELAAAEDGLRRAGVRIVAIPMRAAATPRNEADSSLIADPEPRVVAAFSLFRPAASAAADHFEFLVDRDGYLRARWAPGDTPDWRRIPELLAQVETLKREGPHEAAHAAHVH
jgi:putative copper resistance protein D